MKTGKCSRINSRAVAVSEKAHFEYRPHASTLPQTRYRNIPERSRKQTTFSVSLYVLAPQTAALTGNCFISKQEVTPRRHRWEKTGGLRSTSRTDSLRSVKAELSPPPSTQTLISTSYVHLSSTMTTVSMCESTQSTDFRPALTPRGCGFHFSLLRAEPERRSN